MSCDEYHLQFVRESAATHCISTYHTHIVRQTFPAFAEYKHLYWSREAAYNVITFESYKSCLNVT